MSLIKNLIKQKMIKISRPPNKKKSPSLFPLKITEKEHDYKT